MYRTPVSVQEVHANPEAGRKSEVSKTQTGEEDRMTRTEFRAQVKACRHCGEVSYCHYHSAWNGQLVAEHGREMIAALARERRRKPVAVALDPISKLSVEERLAASIALI